MDLADKHCKACEGGVEALSPEKPEPQELAFEESDGRLRFDVPEFLVYGLARIHLEAESGG